MTGTVAYVLAKKMFASASSGIKSVTAENGEFVFELQSGDKVNVPVPSSTKLVFTLPEDLPPQGEKDTLYIVGSAIKYWDENEGAYITISGTGESLTW